MVEFVVTIVLLAVTFALLLVIVVGMFYAIDVFLDLPYVATKKNKVPTIISLAGIKKGETVVDLGSGDGRLLYESAQLGAHAIGYEINPFLIALTILRRNLKGLSNEILVKRQNLWKADLKIADIIFVYGRKKTMKRFQDFVYKNSTKGTRVVVNTNPFPDKKPIKTKDKTFLYIV